MPSRRHHRRQPQPGPRDSTVTRAKTHDFSLWRGETPIPKGWSPSVVPGAKTTATPMLTPEKVGAGAVFPFFDLISECSL